jgi:cytochrome c-type biogenesis protein CcmE
MSSGDFMKPKIVIGVLVIVAALVYLIVGSFGDNTLYYMTVKELRAKARVSPNEGLRVNGYVVPTTIKWDAEKIELRFTIAEGKDSVRVYYKGVAPDQLADAQQAVVEGKMGVDGELKATKILLKCPSKYEVKDEKSPTTS